MLGSSAASAWTSYFVCTTTGTANAGKYVFPLSEEANTNASGQAIAAPSRLRLIWAARCGRGALGMCD
jgi:hypothetical protein